MKAKTAVLLCLALTCSAHLPAQQARMARVVTAEENPSRCLSAIHVKEVDGVPRQLPARGFYLEPGTHTLHGAARLNLRYCEVHDESGPVSIPPLKAEFVAGRTYYVGLDHSPSDLADWRLVVWRVEASDH